MQLRTKAATVISMIIWCGLFIDRAFSFQSADIISKAAAKLEIIVHIFIFWGLYKIYGKLDALNKKRLFWFAMISVGLFLNDVSWYAISYFKTPNAIYLVSLPVLDLLPFLFWIMSSIIFTTRLLQGHIVEIRKRLKMVLAMVLVNIIVIVFFVLSVDKTDNIFALPSGSHVLISIAKLIAYDFIIVCLMFAETDGLLVFMSGLIFAISGDFFLDYSIISHTAILYTYGELLWFLGLIFNWLGILSVYETGSFEIKDWVRRDNSIKSNLAFWYFSMAIISFLVFFAVAYVFDIINKTVFLGVPLFLMLFSVIVVMVSVYIGRFFEAPFKKLEANIRLLMDQDGTDINLDEKFSMEEFTFLQNFIVEAFKHKAEKDLARLGELAAQKEADRLKLENEAAQAVLAEQEKFRKIVGQVMHDIQSPLSSLGTIIEEQSNNLPEGTRVTLYHAAERIGDIANNLLLRYKNKALENNDQQLLLVSLSLLHILSEKRYEYSGYNVSFVTEFEKLANFAFIKINVLDFERMISNLLNNAVEALRGKKDGVVTIGLNAVAENVVIAIEDNGYGMPFHIKEKFAEGIAISEGKENGHGIGLTQVRDTINANNGKCNIFTTEGERTRFVIKFPKVAAPSWNVTSLRFNLHDTIVILDDDESMHGAWEAKFAEALKLYPEITIKYFREANAALDFVASCGSDMLANIVLLTDYELLGQNINGIEIIEKAQVREAILVTSYAINSDIQNQIMKMGGRLLPKELISVIGIEVDKQLQKFSKKVDILWLEDQKWFVDDLVKNYYQNLVVDIYTNPDLFLEEIIQYPLDTRIILDTYYQYENGEFAVLDGFMIAQKLHNMGYSKLILFSGEEVDLKDIPEYLQVVLKNDSKLKKELNLL